MNTQRKIEVKKYRSNYRLIITDGEDYFGVDRTTEFDPADYLNTEDVVDTEIEALIDKGLITRQDVDESDIKIDLMLAFANDIPDEEWRSEEE